MNTIFIQDLRLETRIGVYEWEQHVGQPLLLNIEFEIPSAKAFASDKLADSCDPLGWNLPAVDGCHVLLGRVCDISRRMLAAGRDLAQAM